MRLKKPKPMEGFPSYGVIMRFMSFIKVEGNCWIWKGYKDPKGYGQFWMDGTTYWAARVSHLIFKGEIAEGLEVHHDPNECGNSSCVHPAHLSLLTKSENSRDADVRRWQGVKSGK